MTRDTSHMTQNCLKAPIKMILGSGFRARGCGLHRPEPLPAPAASLCEAKRAGAQAGPAQNPEPERPEFILIGALSVPDAEAALTVRDANTDARGAAGLRRCANLVQ